MWDIIYELPPTRTSETIPASTDQDTTTDKQDVSNSNGTQPRDLDTESTGVPLVTLPGSSGSRSFQNNSPVHESQRSSPKRTLEIEESDSKLQTNALFEKSKRDHSPLDHDANPRKKIKEGKDTAKRYSYPDCNADYQHYALRLKTFLCWPHQDIIDSNLMARTGLFYTGNQDLVRCFHCGIGLKDWASSDDPTQVHIRHSPGCEFLRATIPQSELEVYRGLLLDEDVNSDTKVDFPQHPQSQDTVPLLQPSQSRPQRYRNPTYVDYDDRVASFLRWPSNIVQTPQQLAEAGFFYTGIEDIVRCYACDGGLRKWDLEDDPWIEHAHWFPHCVHVIRERGQEYIDLIQVAAANDEEEDVGEQSKDMEHLYVNNNTGRESDDPIYSPPAQTAIDFGFSRAAVKMAIQECNDKHISWKAENRINILLEKQEKGETLPTDSPRSRSPVFRRKIDSSTNMASLRIIKC